MTTPVDLATNVGYCVAADVYCSFSEYYGDGTVYGWRHIYVGDSVVRGAGKTKQELIDLGAYQEEAICPAVPADILILPADGPAPEAPAPEAPAPEVPAPEVTVAPAAEMSIERSLSSILIKIKGVTVQLNAKEAKDIKIDISDLGVLTFTL